MPSLEWNQRKWGHDHDWVLSGGEWSEAWGTEGMQWFGCLLPRLQAYLPAQSIVEIAPGFGRWPQFLRENCDRYFGFDLSAACVEACQKRFEGDERMMFSVNDGRSLPGIENCSVDLVFSFDSLVHVERDVIAAYAAEISRVLKPTGVAFLHHSNLGEYYRYFRVVKAIKDRLSGSNASTKSNSTPPTANSGIGTRNDRDWIHRIRRYVPIDSDRSRGISMSARIMEDIADEFDLICVSQETINWGTNRMIDCISVLAPRSSDRAKRGVLSNANFMREAEMLNRLSGIYG